MSTEAKKTDGHILARLAPHDGRGVKKFVIGGRSYLSDRWYRIGPELAAELRRHPLHSTAESHRRLREGEPTALAWEIVTAAEAQRIEAAEIRRARAAAEQAEQATSPRPPAKADRPGSAANPIRA